MAKMKKSEGDILVSSKEKEIKIAADANASKAITKKGKKNVVDSGADSIQKDSSNSKEINTKKKTAIAVESSKVNSTKSPIIKEEIPKKVIKKSVPKSKAEAKIAVSTPVVDEIKTEIKSVEVIKQDVVGADVKIASQDNSESETTSEGKRRKRRSKKVVASEFEPYSEPIKIEGKAFKLRKGEEPLVVPSKKENVEPKVVAPAPVTPPPPPAPVVKHPATKSHSSRRNKRDDHHRKENKYLAQAEEIKASFRNQEPRLDPYRPEPKKTEIVPKAPAADMRYSEVDLEMFFNVISTAKNESIEELRMLRERLDDLTSSDHAEESMIYSMHMAEQGSEAMEKEKTYAQVQRISEYLKKLDDALDRIKTKTYGICRICGCLIAKERLLAVPITTLSAAYKIHEKCPEDNIDKIEPLKGKISV